MKQVSITFIILTFALIFFGAMVSCSRSVILDMYQPRMQDTSTYTPRTITRADTTETPDTSRVPISFGVTVDGWGEENDVNF